MDHSFANTSRPPRFFRLPQTGYGWSSAGLVLAFLVLLGLWLLYIEATPKVRPTFFSDPLHAVLLLSAAGAGIAGAAVGILALVAKRERSFTIVLSVLLGTFVFYWTCAEIIGH